MSRGCGGGGAYRRYVEDGGAPCPIRVVFIAVRSGYSKWQMLTAVNPAGHFLARTGAAESVESEQEKGMVLGSADALI